MRSILIAVFVNTALFSCKSNKSYITGRYLLPYINPLEESTLFVDSLQKLGVDTFLTYYRDKGREIYIFWMQNKELEVSKITTRQIEHIDDWTRVGRCRNRKLFDFYEVNKKQLQLDTIHYYPFKVKDGTEYFISHYLFNEITLSINDSLARYKIPLSFYDSDNNSRVHYLRLIESILFNIISDLNWAVGKKGWKYYPKKYDPSKEKWIEWEQNQINSGKIYDERRY